MYLPLLFIIIIYSFPLLLLLVPDFQIFLPKTIEKFCSKKKKKISPKISRCIKSLFILELIRMNKNSIDFPSKIRHNGKRTEDFSTRLWWKALVWKLFVNRAINNRVPFLFTRIHACNREYYACMRSDMRAL